MYNKIYNLKYKITNKIYVILVFLKLAGKTLKRCHKCGNKRLSEFYSLNKKYCSDCESWFNWKLDKGQKRLFEV